MSHRLWTLALGIAACGTEPQTSYCEAVCDVAVDCANQERTVDVDALSTSCLTATRDANEECATAEGDGVNAADGVTLTECTDAVAEMECSNFTGTLDELKTAAPPTACAAQEAAVETVTAAQDSVLESNDELCTRFSETFCNRTFDCMVEDFGGSIPDSAIKKVGSQPVDLCLDSVSAQTDSCTNDGLYDVEADLTDANVPRQTARSCLADISTISCTDLLSGTMPKVCAGSFNSPKDAAAFAQGLLDTATAFQKAAK